MYQEKVTAGEFAEAISAEIFSAGLADEVKRTGDTGWAWDRAWQSFDLDKNLIEDESRNNGLSQDYENFAVEVDMILKKNGVI